MRRLEQLSLFEADFGGRAAGYDPLCAAVFGRPESRIALDGADEMRGCPGTYEDVDLGDGQRVFEDHYAASEPDELLGFSRRYDVFEYAARMYELVAYRYVLDQILNGHTTEVDAGVAGQMPAVFEGFCAHLALFVWDGWSDVTPHSDDRGLDVLVRPRRCGRPVAAIQAKYLQGHLTPNYVREMHGALGSSQTPITHGLILTTTDAVTGRLPRPHATHVTVSGGRQIRAIVDALRLLTQYVVAYTGFIADATTWLDTGLLEEFGSVAARLVVLRERIAEILTIPPDWPCAIRMEAGISDVMLDQWRGEPFARLF